MAVSIPMAAAVFFAHLQVRTDAHGSKAGLAASAQVKTPAIQSKIDTSPVVSVNDQDNKLQNIINQFVDSHPGHKWSVQVQGLGDDERTASYSSTHSYRSASMFKLLLMYPLIQKTPMSQWSSTDVQVNGQSRTLSDCVSAMLKVSDNPCGAAVGDYVGWEDADVQLNSIGLQNTDLNNPQGPTTSAADISYYLQGLYNGKWFDGATRSFIINILQQQVLRSGIPTGCGSQCKVADKTGDLGYVRHDAGIVRYPGGQYVLSIFTDGASYSQIAQLAGQLQTAMLSH
ncbi:MAG TPA: serine hydrolase [Candidatus Saccharimonadales bacterium]|nr:serine hydrolase [Candidatus Saccharimonadales bacterium]